MKLVALLACTFFCLTARAEPPAGRYAAAQLSVAQEYLQLAREAEHAADYSRAGVLAWQAGLDARLTWEMSESPVLRSSAVRVAEEARRLVRRIAERSR